MVLESLLLVACNLGLEIKPYTIMFFNMFIFQLSYLFYNWSYFKMAEIVVDLSHNLI